MKRFYIHGAAVGAMLLFGLTFVWTKIVFKYYGPITTIFVRLLLSFIILNVLSFFLKKNQKINRKDILPFAISALASPFFYFYFENYGLELVSPTIAAIIVATIPLFSPLAGYIFMKEKLSLLNISGLLLSTAGIGVMMIDKNLNFQADPKGVLLLFGAVAAAIWYSVATKKLSERYNTITIVKMQNIISFFYFMPFFFVKEYQQFISVVPTTELIVTMLELALFASAIAFILFTYALKNLGVGKSNLYSNLIPVFTAIFSFFMIGEQFSMDKVLGMFIVLVGLMLSQGSLNFSFMNKKVKKVS
ncbi:MAG: DMT family transporter [Hyphomicrobiales bacterium]